MNLWLWRDGCLAWPILGHQGRQEKLARLADAADHHLLREISGNILGNVFIRKYQDIRGGGRLKRIDANDNRLLPEILGNIIGNNYIEKYQDTRGGGRQWLIITY